MSNAQPLAPSSQTPSTWSWKVPTFTISEANSSPAAAKKLGSGSSTRATQSPAPSIPVNRGLPASKQPSEAKQYESTRKRRRLDSEEEEIRNRIASSVALSLEADHIQALYPDADSPFENEIDVVNRLLPFHVFQQPTQDLATLLNPKGKGKATSEDLLEDEIEGTKFAIDCHKRFRNLQDRFRTSRLAGGKHSSPLPQAIVLERHALDSDKSESSALDQELSSARAELDKLLRAQRLATLHANRQTAQSQPSAPTKLVGYSNPAFSVTPMQAYNQYYNTYTYSYGQSTLPYASGSSSMPTFASSSQLMDPSLLQGSKPSTSTFCPAPLSTPVDHSQAQPPLPVAIPLQIPVTSLPALQALGILPVPKAALPRPSEPQPPAVLIGTTNNGSMLSLEINAALLQAPQMSGLAILLSGLVKMSGGPSGSGKDGPNAGQQNSSSSGMGSEGSTAATSNAASGGTSSVT